MNTLAMKDAMYFVWLEFNSGLVDTLQKRLRLDDTEELDLVATMVFESLYFQKPFGQSVEQWQREAAEKVAEDYEVERVIHRYLPDAHKHRAPELAHGFLATGVKCDRNERLARAVKYAATHASG